MAPVFGHGRLRLYLLKLLEESPRHGYEVIRLLRDRFLGVYSPSPGTIYPRLARLEEEGLVTHEVLKGKKIYSVTNKGRAELERRMDELAELEDEISASAQSFAREVQQDVRQTVRSLREELTQAARDIRGQGGVAKDAWKGGAERQKDEWRRQKEHWQEQSRSWKEGWQHTWEDAWKTAVGSQEEVSALRLDRTLRQFVEDVRLAAQDTGFDREKLAAAQAVLEETVERLRTDVLGRPTPDPGATGTISARRTDAADDDPRHPPAAPA